MHGGRGTGSGRVPDMKNPRDFEIDEQGIYFQKLQNHLQMFKLFMIFYLKQ